MALSTAASGPPLPYSNALMSQMSNGKEMRFKVPPKAFRLEGSLNS